MINFKPTLAKADKTYRDLDYSGILRKPYPKIVSLYIALKNMSTKTPLHAEHSLSFCGS